MDVLVAMGTTAAFAVEMAPHARESWEGVLHACKFDLEPGFTRLCAFGKDVENDFLAVDHADVAEGFPFALLGGGELIVDHDAVAVVGSGEVDDFGSLAGAAGGDTFKIGRRLDRDIAATHKGLRSAFLWMAGTAVTLLLIGFAVVLGSRAKRGRSPIF